MRVPLTYPKMPGSRHSPAGPCVAFEKYDGTNLHWVWDDELGWHAFGTRRDRYDLDERGMAEFAAAHPGLESAASLFRSELARRLRARLEETNRLNGREVIAFTEFLGPKSFAGRHVADEPKRLVLFDLWIGDAFLPPEEFADEFGELDAARIVYRGRLTGKFINDVREGRYSVAEGVVCKGVENGQVWMVKVKTNAYRIRLEEAYADGWEAYWE